MKITGIEELQERLEGRVERLKNPMPIYQVLSQDVLAAISDCFDKEESPDGVSWAPLKPSTLKRKRAGSTKILQDKGILRLSFLANVSNEGFSITTGVPYAKWHQEGTSKMPARPFMPIGKNGERIPAELWERIIDDFGHYIRMGEEIR